MGRNDDDRLRRALELLRDEAKARLQARPGSTRKGKESLQLNLRLPLGNRSSLDRERDDLTRELDKELDRLVARRSLIDPGRVRCLRCGSSRCEHAAPSDPRHVFAGYGPSGIPRFEGLAQLLLELRDERAEHLFRRRKGLVTLVRSAEELTESLLPAYRERLESLELHGQVAAGWYPLRGEPEGDSMALDLHLVSTGRGRRRKLSLHPVGRAADEATLQRLLASRGRIPWRPAARWARDVLATIEAELSRGERMPVGKLRGRLDGVLRHLAERLERPSRRRKRSTAHAEARHESRRRPTGAAISDLRDAPLERIFRDTRHDTLVVLGPKNRAHVFSHEGKLVTSIRYPSGTIDKRQKQGQWVPASTEEARGLRHHVADATGGD